MKSNDVVLTEARKIEREIGKLDAEIDEVKENLKGLKESRTELLEQLRGVVRGDEVPALLTEDDNG